MRTIIGGVTLIVLLATSAGAQVAEIDGILGLQPVVREACLAVEISLPPGQALSGLRWFHNDSTIAFPRLLLMESQPETPPDLASTGMILEEIAGESLAWGDVALSQPVTSSTGTISAVFIFPQGVGRTGEGTYGGPGIGYKLRSGGRRAFISAEGQDWVQVHPRVDVLVEPVFTSALMVAASTGPLSSLKSATPPAEAEASPDDTAPPLRTELLVPHPNPFNPRVEIRFSLRDSAPATLTLYNLRGRRVRRLVDGTLEQGVHRIIWNGQDDAGMQVSNGVYLVRLVTVGQTFTQKLALVR